MTVALVILAIVFGTPFALVLALELSMSLRMRRRRREHGQSDREVADALRPYGAYLTIAPLSSAPPSTNGAGRESTAGRP